MDENSLEELDSIFRSIDQPVWIVSTEDCGNKSGLTATWIHQASIDRKNPMVLIGLAPNHFTCEILKKSECCVLHLLEVGQAEIARKFACPSSRDHDKFAGMEINRYILEHSQDFRRPSAAESRSLPWLADCHSAMACQTITHFDAGDRIYFLSRVMDLIQTRPGPFMRESDFFASCSAAQINQLKEDLLQDVKRQRPLLEKFLQNL